MNQEELPNLCSMCQGAHRTMDCPKPRCWVCRRQQAPYHWPKSCTSATCEICRSKHHKFFCPMNPDRPCARCGKRGHIAPVCSAASTLPCDLCQPSDHTIAACPIPRCMRCLSPEHLESGCPSGERHGTGSSPPAMCFNCHQPGHSSWDCSREVVCNKCGEPGHYKKNCPDPEVREMYRCRACGQGGHIQRDCPLYSAPSSSSGLFGVIAAATNLFGFSLPGNCVPRTELSGPGRTRSRFSVTDDR